MRPNNLRARNAIIFLYCALFIDLLNASVEGYMLTLNEFDIDYFNKILQYSIYLSYLTIVMLVVTLIHIILWFRRAYYNLHVLGIQNLRYTEGWAAGSWFVPFMNFFAPYKIMNDIWIETQRAIFRNDDYKPNQKISIWWTFWILQFVMSRFMYSVYKNAETVTDFNNANTLSIICNTFDVIAKIMLILIIRELSIYEHDLYESRTNTEASILFDVIEETEMQQVNTDEETQR